MPVTFIVCVFICTINDLYKYRSSFKSAVASLFDACPSVSNQQLFPGISAEVDTVPAGPGMGALVWTKEMTQVCILLHSLMNLL